MISTYRPLFGPVTVVATWHITGGISCLIFPQASLVSALAGINAPPGLMAVMLIGAAGLALWARVTVGSHATLLLIPQQILLFLQAYGVLMALGLGQYPDGYMPVPTDIWASRGFIFGDQVIVLILTAWHTVEMLRLAAWMMQDREISSELSELRRRVACYEEGGYWTDLVACMELKPKDE